jgi:hypothetical protein
MKRALLLVSLLALVQVHTVSEEAPGHYVKKDSWQETMRASREELLRLEQAGEMGTPLPDMGAGDFTIMAWIRTEAKTGTIAAKAAPRRRGRNRDRSSTRRQPQNKALYLNDGAPAYEISSVGLFASRTRVNNGRWHHVALVGDRPLELYVDGRLRDTGSIGKRGDVKPDDPSHVLTAGLGVRALESARRGLDGDIDELRIYSRRLTAEEIKLIYKKAEDVGDALAGWWQFEEEGVDSSGNENNGRVFRGEETAGRIGKALRLTGRGGMMLPQSRGATLREELWALVSRDFNDEQAKEEIDRERKDSIWAGDWKAGDLGELAGRYARAARNVGRLPEKAGELASAASNATDLQRVRDVYHLSILNETALADLPARIKATRPAIAHLTEEYEKEYSKRDEYIARLEGFEESLAELEMGLVDPEGAGQLSEDFRQFQHEAVVAGNPLMNFDKLLFVKRYTYQSSHYYTDFIDGCEHSGGNLCILDLEDGTVTDLLPSMSHGIFGRYDLSFDGKRIAFDWKESLDKGFRIYEVGVDGTGLRQLTFPPPDEQERIEKYDNSFTGAWRGLYNHHTDDMHPCYLPDGGICFTSTRCEYGTLCDAPDVLTTPILYRIDGDGSNIRKLTNSAVSEFGPVLMEDGRILYSRWEYVDKGQIGGKCLWVMRPDGSGTAEIFGNDIALPPVFIHARPIPGHNDMFVTMGTPHFPQSGVGTVIRLDINRPIRTREPMTYITPHIDIRAEGGFDHRVGDGWVRNLNGPVYMDPYPLSEKFFLVSHNPDKPWNDVRAYGLYMIDEFGNHVLVYKDQEFSSWQPMPLRPRQRPPVIPSMLPEEIEEEQAVVVMTDVYEGLQGVERGAVKYLRIMEQVPRPWDARRFWAQESSHTALVSMGPVLGLKVLHGIVPVYEDGSAHFVVPHDRNIYFQALDENFMEIQRQRTYINYRPGEKRSCIGCHEYRQLAPGNKSVMALNYPPSAPEAQPGETAPRPIHYATDVQPVLDRHCIDCHGGAEPAGRLALTGEMTNMYSRSYENILRRDLVVTTDEGSDFGGTEPVLPRTIGSHASRLITVLREGHEGVELAREEMIKLTTWVDANAQYYGTYYGRKDLGYEDHPNFRPVPTFAEAVSSETPHVDEYSRSQDR